MADGTEDLALPTALAEAAEVGFDWEWDEETDEVRGCDFELYDRFEAPDQPVVYIGSEGERGVIARDLGDLLWLFAAGLGPAEAFTRSESAAQPNEAFQTIAERHAPGRRSSPAEIVAAAQAQFPHFSDLIDEMCR